MNEYGCCRDSIGKFTGDRLTFAQAIDYARRAPAVTRACGARRSGARRAQCRHSMESATPTSPPRHLVTHGPPVPTPHAPPLGALLSTSREPLPLDEERTPAPLGLSILLVEDDPVFARLVRASLEPSPEGSDWRLAHVESLAAACAVTETPDLIVLDLTLPDGRGLETLARVRERFAFVPVILLTAVEDLNIEERALRAGAQDFLGKDELTPRSLRRVVRYAMERHRAQLDLMRLSTRDELTGLYNRRGFFMAAEPLARLAERAGRAFVVFYADLDGLKNVNDTLGHHAGDEAIRDAAWVLNQTFRSADIVARLGGDEFAVLANEAPAECVEVMIRRLGKWQAERNAETDRQFAISLSVGAASWSPDAPKSLLALLEDADAAAYTAKRRTR
jgi:two-component system, cell cycle response regulator